MSFGNVQHLSDEAVAAFADGVLVGSARERATRHSAACPECAHAVATQREAIWALRAAPAPSLPTALMDRLRAVPTTTPIAPVPTAIDRNGAPVFASFGSAAFVPAPKRTGRHVGPFVATAAAVAVAGVLVVGSAGGSGPTRPTRPATVNLQRGGGAAVIDQAVVRFGR